MPCLRGWMTSRLFRFLLVMTYVNTCESDFTYWLMRSQTIRMGLTYEHRHWLRRQSLRHPRSTKAGGCLQKCRVPLMKKRRLAVIVYPLTSINAT